MWYRVPCLRADELLRFLSRRGRAGSALSPASLPLLGRRSAAFGRGARCPAVGLVGAVAPRRRGRMGGLGGGVRGPGDGRAARRPAPGLVLARPSAGAVRSEERRVGKGWRWRGCGGECT